MVVGGRSLPLRSALLDRLPAVGTGRVSSSAPVSPSRRRPRVAAARPRRLGAALPISMGTAIVCLSLVVVTGFVGQLSLAQMALAGFGAWAAGRLATSFRLAVPPRGDRRCARRRPRRRARRPAGAAHPGINLAVLTFGLSVLISEMVLGNSALTGGFDGTRPDPPTIFGVEIDACATPTATASSCSSRSLAEPAGRQPPPGRAGLGSSRSAATNAPLPRSA